jgi:hypothetical protein
VPAFTNAASNVVFNIFAGETNLLSAIFPNGILTNQWAFVGSVELDASLSNHVSMFVNGTNQPGSYAICDVLRVVPAPDSAFQQVSMQNPILFLPEANENLLRFAGQGGVNYLIQRSPDLTSGWATLSIQSPGANGTLEFVDEKPPAEQAFYRILAQ